MMLMRSPSSCEVLNPYIWHNFCSWSVKLFTQGFHQKVAYFPNDGWTLKCPISSSDMPFKNVNKFLWWFVGFKLHRAEERKYCEVIFVINKTSISWKYVRGKYKSQSNSFWCNWRPCWRPILSNLSVQGV